MLTKLRINNFKCLRKIDMDLDWLTVLVGPNDSGKSSLLQALRLLGNVATKQYTDAFADIGPVEHLAWGMGKETRIELCAEGIAGEKTFSYDLVLPAADWQRRGQVANEFMQLEGETVIAYADGDEGNRMLGNSSASDLPYKQPHTGATLLYENAKRAYSNAKTVAMALSASTEYHFDQDAMRAPCTIRFGVALEPDGANLVSVLDGLISARDRTNLHLLEKQLHDELRFVKSISTQPVDGEPGKKILEFVLAGDHQPPVAIPASQASDGAMLLTAYLAMTCGEMSEILLIEEPENGLHPSRMEFVVDLLRKISTGEIGNRRRQVILTTHSPILLNYVEPEDVRIVTRDAEQGTKVTPMMEAKNIESLREEFSTGELWYLLGEEGLVQDEALLQGDVS